MELRYNVVQMETPYTRDPRQHHHHHDLSESETGSTQSSEKHSCPGMAMYFHGGDVETILFKFWQTDSALAIIASCVAVFIVAVLYELLKFYREWLKQKERRRLEGGAHRRRSSRRGRRRRSKSVTVVKSADEFSLPIASSTIVPGNPQTGITVRLPWLAPMHMYQTLLHMLQVTISFMLMLVFMTFNVWLCLAVVLGAGFGYFLFFVRNESITEHCN